MRLQNVTAILSMLHEPPGAGGGTGARNSATRRFRGEPVLAWTLSRVARAAHVTDIAVICWEDQLADVAPIAEAGAHVLVKDPRIPMPDVDAVAAARRWADGWRGGLLSTCDFDLGFHGPWHWEVAAELDSDAVLLIDPSAGLVDPALLDKLVEQAKRHEQVEICFCPAACGLGAALLRPALLSRLSAARAHPGRLLHYLPDQLSREPLAGDGCVPVATTVARTTGLFTLDSDRQIERIERATVSLNGELITSDAEAIVHRVRAEQGVDALPREVVLELNTTRQARPIYWAGRHLEISRAPMPLDRVVALLDELSGADDLRLTLAGVGDPLLSPDVFSVIEAAASRGIRSIHVETDLSGVNGEQVKRLARAPIDVVSVHLPALTAGMYEAVMGLKVYPLVLDNVRTFVSERQALGRRLPLIVPVFTKCSRNLIEMEAWYDTWLRALGCAVIAGPTDCAGQVPDAAVADMSPPKRTPCARIESRMTVLCDGRVVSCEQDVLGAQVVGEVGKQPVREIWQQSFGKLRASHREGRWSQLTLCGQCREWHRP